MATNDSIFSKIRLITLGNVHQLLNTVIDLNSIAAIEQHMRDLNAAYRDLEGNAAEAEGHKRWIQKQVTAKQGEKTGVDTSIKAILTDDNPDNDHLAKALGVKAVGLQKNIETLRLELTEATETDTAIDQAVSQLDARIQSLNNQLEHLRTLDASAKAKEKAANALSQASSVVSSGTGLNVDNVAARIEQRSETANAKLEKAMGSMNVVVEGDMQMAEAEAYLAQMKANLEK